MNTNANSNYDVHHNQDIKCSYTHNMKLHCGAFLLNRIGKCMIAIDPTDLKLFRFASMALSMRVADAAGPVR